ncbi:hypothetical protein [Nocardioides sp. GXZ039]|uniref:hypothetical protein n=1 Tax=Nocardioides sp. GXZ039 TaxID=3136018 RepID=UPI0030F3B1D3
MSTRTEIAEAANAVEEITAHTYVVPDLEPGTVYPRLSRTDYPNRFGGIAHWSVVLVLPQDLAEAEQYLERMQPLLIEALAPVLPITSVEPQRLQLDGVGVLPVAFFNGHREAD